MNISLGKRISGCRKQLGLTQEQLAEKLGLTAQAVSKWENDISCPDITVLPKLADIFGITTDALLGHEIPPLESGTADETSAGQSGPEFEYDSISGNMRFHWDIAKFDKIAPACWVLLTGAVFLIAQLLRLPVSLWNVTWPCFLLVFGLFGLYPKFSVFRLASFLVGGYFLADKLQLLDFQLNRNIIFSACILLFGVSLLFEALQKGKGKDIRSYFDKQNQSHRGKVSQEYSVNGTTFSYDASFGCGTQLIKMEKLSHGTISTSFGDYTVDLRGVTTVESGCKIQADCSFGCLTVLVPSQCCVLPDGSTSFASFDIQGAPNQKTVSNIYLSADVSFGQICIRYI